MGTRTMIDMCDCGEPLHYRDDSLRQQMDAIVRGRGDRVVVTLTPSARSFSVQRHYIALHGIKGEDLIAGTVPGAVEVTSEQWR